MYRIIARSQERIYFIDDDGFSVCFIIRSHRGATYLTLPICTNVIIYSWCLCLGNDEDYLNIAIKEGGISVLMKVTTGKLDMYIKPNKVRFDDYRWHKIILHRRIKEVRLLTYSIAS